MAKPTQKQIAFLKNRGIEPARTKSACSKQIAFVIHGNGTHGNNEAERISYLRAIQYKYFGKRVKVTDFNYGVIVRELTGRVTSIWPPSAEEISARRRLGEISHPCHCSIMFDGGGSRSNMSLTSAELMEEVDPSSAEN